MRTTVSVASLLNPSPLEKEEPDSLHTPYSFLYNPEVSPRMPLPRKQKLCKDEATFVKGKPQEEVKYWPCEIQDDHLTAEHRKYQMYPIGHITEYCKYVPYRSEKKTFLSKTGREGFHGEKINRTSLDIIPDSPQSFNTPFRCRMVKSDIQ